MTPVTYLRLRRMGLRNAWQLSGMPEFTMSVLKYAGAVALAFGLWLLTGHRVDAAVANKDAEIVELRKIVAACVGDKYGTLKIGDEWFICGIDPIGRM